MGNDGTGAKYTAGWYHAAHLNLRMKHWSISRPEGRLVNFGKSDTLKIHQTLKNTQKTILAEKHKWRSLHKNHQVNLRAKGWPRNPSGFRFHFLRFWCKLEVLRWYNRGSQELLGPLGNLQRAPPTTYPPPVKSHKVKGQLSRSWQAPIIVSPTQIFSWTKKQGPLEKPAGKVIHGIKQFLQADQGTRAPTPECLWKSLFFTIIRLFGEASSFWFVHGQQLILFIKIAESPSSRVFRRHFLIETHDSRARMIRVPCVLYDAICSWLLLGGCCKTVDLKRLASWHPSIPFFFGMDDTCWGTPCHLCSRRPSWPSSTNGAANDSATRGVAPPHAQVRTPGQDQSVWKRKDTRECYLKSKEWSHEFISDLFGVPGWLVDARVSWSTRKAQQESCKKSENGEPFGSHAHSKCSFPNIAKKPLRSKKVLRDHPRRLRTATTTTTTTTSTYYISEQTVKITHMNIQHWLNLVRSNEPKKPTVGRSGVLAWLQQPMNRTSVPSKQEANQTIHPRTYYL